MERISFDSDDTALNIPMDSAASYDIGTVPDDFRFYPEQLTVFVDTPPTISTGTFSLGTNSPNYNNVVAATSWGLLGLSAHSARRHQQLGAGGPTAPVDENLHVYLKVSPGIADSGGVVRVALEGLKDPK